MLLSVSVSDPLSVILSDCDALSKSVADLLHHPQLSVHLPDGRKIARIADTALLNSISHSHSLAIGKLITKTAFDPLNLNFSKIHPFW